MSRYTSPVTRMYPPIIVPSAAEIAVSHSHGLGVADYNSNELYSPDTAFWRSKVLDLVSPKYSPNNIYIFDKSRYCNHGTIAGATWTRLPSGLWVLNFDGTDDDVNCGNNAILNFTTSDFTIIQWLYLTAFNVGDSFVLQRGATDVSGYGELITSDGRWLYRLDQAGSHKHCYSDVGVVTAETWMMLTAVRTAARKLYKNATDVTSADEGNTDPVTTTNNLYLGRDNAGTEDFNGRLALVRIFNRALTANEIASIYNQERHLFGV